MIIYKVTNKVSGKIYVGQTIHSLEKRRKQHEESALGGYNEMVFGRALKKYGVENFEWEIIDTAETVDELNEKEIYWIDKLESLIDYGHGYNCNKGGKNGKHSEYTKKAIGDAQRGELNHAYGKTGALNPSSKKVIDLSTDIIYESAIQCGLKTGLCSSKISAVCRGDRGSTGGKVFRYLDDNNQIIEVDYKNSNTREDKHIYNVDTMECFKNFTEVDRAMGNISKNSTLSNKLKNGGVAVHKGQRWCLGEENIDKARALKISKRKMSIPIINLTTGEKFPSIRNAVDNSRLLSKRLLENNGHCIWKGQKWAYLTSD